MTPKVLRENACTLFILFFFYVYIQQLFIEHLLGAHAILDYGPIGVHETEPHAPGHSGRKQKLNNKCTEYVHAVKWKKVLSKEEKSHGGPEWVGGWRRPQ